jgi:hypothetical protein
MGSRVSIVEDDYETARELDHLLHESFSDLRVDFAHSEAEAIHLIKATAEENMLFDAAVLDFKLPRQYGGTPVANQETFRIIRDLMPSTTVIHTTAYPEDRELTQLILAEARQSPLLPRSVFLSKADRGWSEDLVGIVRDSIALRSRAAPETPEYASCFISYSHADENFVSLLYSRLKHEGLQIWYAAEHMKPGRKLAEEIEVNVRLYDKLLLILSSTSMGSGWVATEMRMAVKEERRTGRKKLFPLRLVKFEDIQNWSSFNADVGKDMAAELREYFIQDFSGWEDGQVFELEARKLLDALRSS